MSLIPDHAYALMVCVIATVFIMFLVYFDRRK